jgi:hypothetical protein
VSEIKINSHNTSKKESMEDINKKRLRIIVIKGHQDAEIAIFYKMIILNMIRSLLFDNIKEKLKKMKVGH